MNPVKPAREAMGLLRHTETRVEALERTVDRMRLAMGRVEARQLRNCNSVRLRDHEFSAFSQYGDDGILQFLVRQIPGLKESFIEFGVEDYSEANTRFLLEHDNWRGVIFDSDGRHIARIRRQPYCCRHSLSAVEALVTRENVNDLFRSNGFEGEIGLLSVDVDGNDYWIWDAIDCVRSALVVVEYNHRFGPERAVTIPYDPGFDRRKAHHSGIYYGASLGALCRLGARKGYAFVGCNSAGNNAWFVERERKPDPLPELSPAEGDVAGKFRESRDPEGNLTFPSPAEEQRILTGLPTEEID